MARYEANENGFDEAIMLDQNGYVAEGNGENIFVVQDGVITTCPWRTSSWNHTSDGL